jgi:biopolymer transport protein ExbB/TolQ
MKSSTGQKIGLPVDRGRHRSPNFVLLGLDLLTSIGLDLLRRHAKSWTASLKEEVGARRAVLKRQMLDTSKSDRPNSLLPERAQKEGGKLQRNRSVTQVLTLLKNTAKEWNQDKCPQLGAALAYYTVFSLAPLMGLLPTVVSPGAIWAEGLTLQLTSLRL